MMLLLVAAATTAALLWLASREKPQYSKAYFRTRSDGVFRTDYAPGFREYIETIDEEVAARFTIGPISPFDDLHADLYHPEIESNWRRELSRSRLNEWIRDALDVILAVTTCIALADLATGLLTHRRGMLASLTSDPTLELLVAWAFALIAYAYLQRSRNAIIRTQGYLDGYSGRCAGLERGMRVIEPL